MLSSKFDTHFLAMKIRDPLMELILVKSRSVEGVNTIKGNKCYLMLLDMEGRPQAVHESGHSVTFVAHEDPQIFSMSNLHNLQPVIETIPPFIFIVMRVAIDDCGYSVLLWKNGQYLTVQFPAPVEPPEDLSVHLEEEIRQLQPFANSLVFGKTNRAYFVNNNNGKRALAYRQKSKSSVQYPPFAPLVHESELKYLRPIGLNLVEGRWRGQQGTFNFMESFAP